VVTARFGLSDVEAKLVQPRLPNKARGVARMDDRRVLNGIFGVLRTASPGRDLPGRFGPSTTIDNRCNRWAKAGVWVRMFATLPPPHCTSVSVLRKREKSSPCELICSLA
jgi:transposase